MVNNNNDSKGRLLKIGEAANILHVSPQTVRDWTEAGKIQAETSPGGTRFYYEADVKKLALSEKGVTSYWVSSIIVAITSSKDKAFYLNTETWEPASNPQILMEEFDRFWNFNNGLQLQPHMVALTDKPVIFTPDVSYPYLVEIPGVEEIGLAANATVLGLNKEDVLRLSKTAMAQTFEYLVNNFTPKQTVTWFNDKGKEIRL